MASGMRPLITPILCLILAMSMSASAYAGSTVRLSHALAQTGTTDIVICGTDGPQSITLNVQGQPVSPRDLGCDHCADCQLIAFAVPVGRVALTSPVWRSAEAACAPEQLYIAQNLRLAHARAPPVVQPTETIL